MTGPLGRISRIAFVTDMTRGDAPVIPLGYMVEGAWLDRARWLGLIGRTRLTPLEPNTVDLTSWAQLESPYDLLNSFFDRGWAATWGEAGSIIQQEWLRSALQITIDDYSSTMQALTVTSPRHGPRLVKRCPLTSRRFRCISSPVSKRQSLGCDG